jgi:hypothetical protein
MWWDVDDVDDFMNDVGGGGDSRRLWGAWARAARRHFGDVVGKDPPY